MADWTIQTPVLGLQPIAETSTVKKVPLGTIVTAVHQSSTGSTSYGSGEFIYLKGLDSTAVGSWVHYNLDDGSTTLAVANGIGPVAVAMSACLTGEFGWYQISGKAIGKCLSGYADNGAVYLTSTDGSIDDQAVAGDLVHLAKGASAIGTPSAGLAEFEISRPFTDDNVDDLDVS